MKRPLAGALFAAAALSVSSLGVVGAAHAETAPPPPEASTAPSQTISGGQSDTNQITVECTNPDDASLHLVAQLNFVRLAPTTGTPPSYTQTADITTIAAFANDANSTWTGSTPSTAFPNAPTTPSLVDPTATLASIEVKLFGDVTDALTPPPVVFDQTIYNWDGTFNFSPKQDHVSYGTLTAHWTKAGGAQRDEILACSYPGTGHGFPTYGPNYGYH
jgi:hypothetical protein